MDHTRYQQWKQSWLTCGRVLLTLALLTILTTVLYLASQNISYLRNNDYTTEGVRYRRDVSSLNVKLTSPIDNHNESMLSSQETWSSNSNINSQHKNPFNRSLDASITTSTKNKDKTFPSNEHDKSQRLDGITYHTDSSQTVEGGTEQRIKYVLHNKQKMKRKRKKIVSNLSSSSNNNNSNIKLPKSSIKAYKNVTDVNGLENFSPDMVMDENNVAGERVIRHKKDQLIIREDQGVVIVRKYTCVPCQRVPGQRTSIKTRPRYRGMFLRHVCC